MGPAFRNLGAVALLLAGCAAANVGFPQPSGASAASRPAAAFPRQTPFRVRVFHVDIGRDTAGSAIAYGPHRDGQYPGGPSPSRAELRQDLQLMSKHWDLIRLYGAVGPPDTLLQLIREDRLPMQVLLGVWIAPEDRRDSTGTVLERLPGARAANRREIESATRLAARYPEIVAGICVSNETQVSWSANRVPVPLLVGYVREVRARTAAPVTVADDFHYWSKPASRAVARELDFIVTHIHPLWAGRQLEDALDWTQTAFAAVRAAHSGQLVVIGETGWATGKLTTGEQGRLLKGRVGEEQQKAFCDAAAAWARREHVTTFFFEAFDENWKGGKDPDDVEKHWGFYRADRTPKKVLEGAR